MTAKQALAAGVPAELVGRTATAKRKSSVSRKTECERLPAHTRISNLTVNGRPVPWSAPFSARNGGIKPTPASKRLIAWKRRVDGYARISRPIPPYDAGPLSLTLRFHLVKVGSMPDLTNLVKSTEDGLQGVVFLNDRQVKRIHAEIFEVADPSQERAEIQVFAI